MILFSKHCADVTSSHKLLTYEYSTILGNISRGSASPHSAIIGLVLPALTQATLGLIFLWPPFRQLIQVILLALTLPIILLVLPTLT